MNIKSLEQELSFIPNSKEFCATDSLQKKIKTEQAEVLAYCWWAPRDTGAQIDIFLITNLA